MKKKTINLLLLLFAAIAIALSVWGPEALTRYRDRTVLDQIHKETAQSAGEGYRYVLSSNERLYILSQCLNSQIRPESELSAMTRNEEGILQGQELSGTYAFVVNHKGPSGKEIGDDEIYNICNRELDTLKSLKILPDTVQNVQASAYEAVLYSAIDVLEPRNNVSVWKISLSDSQKNANKENRLIDAYIDAEDGRIYEFYVRSELEWQDVDPDVLMDSWRRYIGADEPQPYQSENPLTETTPYFKKYVCKGNGNEKMIVTIGFYEGIRELFLKISK